MGLCSSSTYAVIVGNNIDDEEAFVNHVKSMPVMILRSTFLLFPGYLSALFDMRCQHFTFHRSGLDAHYRIALPTPWQV